MAIILFINHHGVAYETPEILNEDEIFIERIPKDDFFKRHFIEDYKGDVEPLSPPPCPPYLFDIEDPNHPIIDLTADGDEIRFLVPYLEEDAPPGFTHTITRVEKGRGKMLYPDVKQEKRRIPAANFEYGFERRWDGETSRAPEGEGRDVIDPDQVLVLVGTINSWFRIAEFAIALDGGNADRPSSFVVGDAAIGYQAHGRNLSNQNFLFAIASIAPGYPFASELGSTSGFQNNPVNVKKFNEMGTGEAAQFEAANAGFVHDLGDAAQSAQQIEEPPFRVTRSAKRRMDEDAAPVAQRTRSRR